MITMSEKIDFNFKKIEKNPINLDSELISLKSINGASIEQKEEIILYIERELAWLDSNEYILRKKEATGMSESKIKKDIQKIKEQLAKTEINLLNEEADLASGAYSRDKKKPIINIFETYDENYTLNVIDHEIKHAVSEEALETMDDLVRVFCSNYKNYPRINNKKIIDYLIPVGETLGRWASKAQEQQVISKRIMDIMEEDHSIKRGTKLTIDDLKLLIDDLNSQIKNNDIKNNDIITMLHKMKQKHQDSYVHKLSHMVNKAY
jgi:hypothetical protein